MSDDYQRGWRDGQQAARDERRRSRWLTWPAVVLGALALLVVATVVLIAVAGMVRGFLGS